MRNPLLKLYVFKETFYDVAFILLFTFVVYGFTLDNLLWYVASVIVLTPVMFIIQKYVLKLKQYHKDQR